MTDIEGSDGGPLPKMTVDLDIPHDPIARLVATGRLISTQQQKIDKYGLALMMIKEGCADPRKVAAQALAEEA